jgi:uncharacterized glyoxalase superfamily protein PhnB
MNIRFQSTCIRLHHSYFGYLRVDDVDGFFREIIQRGVGISNSISDKPWNMGEFGVTSPEGHKIMIGQWIGEETEV